MAVEHGLTDTTELRRLYDNEAWPRDALYYRVFSALIIVVVAASWATDVAVLGFSTLAWWLLPLRVAAGVSSLPLFIATFRASRPAWVNWAKCGGSVGLIAFLAVVFTLKPTHINVQGWSSVIVLGISGLGIHLPIRQKLIVSAGTFGIYLVHLTIVLSALGSGYGKPNEVIAVVLVAALVVFLSPFSVHRTDEARFQERVARWSLEREVALRREREAALEQAKEAAQRAEREAISLREEAEKAAALTKSEAQKAAREARLRTELLANMSHDLRTPLAGILGLIELMATTPLSEEQSRYVDTIRASNQVLLSLLNDVIDFSRIDEGKLPIHPTSVHLKKTLQSPIDLMRSTASQKGLTLSFEPAADLFEFVKIDAPRVQQILLNLIGNAVKFTYRGRVSVRAFQKETAGDFAVLRVEVVDTGIGFTQEIQGRIFNRFSQADPSIGGKFGGSGLGLSICKGLVALMGGSIGASGEPEKGSTFWFEVPVNRSEPPSVAPPISKLPKLRVLLAEGNPVNQMVLTVMLTQLDQAVSVAADGKQALQMLTAERFDMAIMDMQMPELNGDDVARQIRLLEHGKDRLQIVALTAAASPECREQYLAAGVDAVYTKPIDMPRLRNLLVNESKALLARR
ncbi:MAG: response regulator [Polyangiaceae bacterium]|nr:response regulator [Polyangiaceae bacterium]